MTTNFNTNDQIKKMKTKVNRPKIAKETSSGSTRLFQRTSPTTSVNIYFFYFKNIFQTTIRIIKYSTKIMSKYVIAAWQILNQLSICITKK